MTRDPIDLAPPPHRQRIAKLMARAGLCSRRDAEAWIVAGRVSVNGTQLTSPAMDVAPQDEVLVDGAPIPTAEKTRLFLFHKPRGLVTSDHDPEGRATVSGYLREHWQEGPRVVTVGRLDINTEGLLLLTNDGGLARVMELPNTGWIRRYRVRAKGTPNAAALEALADGITIDGIHYAGIEARLDRTQGANCWLTMGLREGKNREIKRVLEHVGLEVNRLIRLSFGPFQLLDLPEGAVEEVKTRVLRDQLGEKLAQQAGVDLGPAAVPVPAEPEPRPRKPREPERRPMPKGRTDPGARPRRPDKERSVAAPERHRPAAGTRKHVSTLRSAERTEAREGPRKRVERTNTRDRRERAVVVERLVAPRCPAPIVNRRQGDRVATPGFEREPTAQGGRDDRRGLRKERAQPPRRSDRDDETKRDGGGRRHESPSARGKRERISRSGAATHDERPGRSDRKASPRGEPEARDARPRRSDRKAPPRGEPEARDARPRRSDRKEHTHGESDARAGRHAPGKRSPRQEVSSRPAKNRNAAHKRGAGRPNTGAARSRDARAPSDRRGPRGKPRPPSKPKR